MHRVFASSRQQKNVAFACAALGLLCAHVPAALAQTPPEPPSQARQTGENAIGIALENVPYPFPVRYFPLTIEGQNLRMAFMDIAPTSAPNGRTIVLLHGKNFYGSYWDGPIRALSNKGFRVVVPDQIGFGKSGKPDTVHYSFDLLARNTMALLDFLHVDKADVIGHSMGGMLAVRLARAYSARVSHLILENPIGLEDYRLYISPATTEALFEAERKQTEAGYRAFVKNYFVTWKPEYEDFVRVRTGLTRSGEFDRWAKASALTYQMIYEQPVRHEFPLISVPTLLIIGQSDRTVVGKDRAPDAVRGTLGNYPVLGRAANRDIPNSKLVEIPNTGHIPHLESPAAFDKAVQEFLR